MNGPVGPRPVPGPPPVCPLPAVARWLTYPVSASVPLQRRLTVDLPFCRLHDAAVKVRAERRQQTAPPGVELRVMRTELPPRQTLVGCCAQGPAPETVAGCDRARVADRLGTLVGGADSLVSLTLTAADRDALLGNEQQVLQALLDAAEHLEQQIGVVARRLAARAGWEAVADTAPGEVTDASAAEQLWGRRHDSPAADATGPQAASA